MVRRTFWAYSIMHPMVHHIEMYSSENYLMKMTRFSQCYRKINYMVGKEEALIAIERYQKATYF